jgi:glycosyltransferase involved in cell wall biosynthesis
LKHNDWPRLLYVGRLQPSKGVFEALLTFDVVKQQYPNATMKIVGPCNDQLFMERMIRYINENNLQQAVTFLGPVDYKKLPQYFQNADIFLFPSSYEGLPSVVLESMACGTPPVVIRGSGGTEEAVLHGKTGWVVDMPRLAYEVLQILAEPAQLQSTGEQAVLRVNELFSSLRTFDILSSLLSKITHD